MDNNDTNGECGVCGLTGPLEYIQQHFLEEHVDENNECKTNENGSTSEPQRWPREHVLLLIRLVEQHQEKFDSGLKKNVWRIIANNLSKVTNKDYTWDQVDNKWKGLKKTYKKIKDGNRNTGNAPQKWEFFHVMDRFMQKKPEVAPLAVCSSSSTGVHVNTQGNSTAGPSKTTEDIGQGCVSSIMKKRKQAENTLAQRHKEKMAKFDEFLKIYKASVEHQIGTRLE